MDQPLPTSSDSGPRYVRVSPRERPRRPDLYARRLSGVATPLLGSRLLFPRIFDKAVERLLDGSDDVLVLPDHARWYFGRALNFNIDPARLTARLSDFVRDERGPHWIGTSFLDTGDWSKAVRPLARSPVHREVSELVAADLDFTKTRAYGELLAAAGRGRPARRYGVPLAGPAEVDAYFRYCVDLIRSMRKHGIVPRREFRSFRKRWFRHRDVRPPKFEGSERDIGVAIGAGGELVRHLGGKHRTAIAQAVGLHSIPIEIRLVHVGWLAGEMERTGLPAHQALGQALRALREDPLSRGERVSPQATGEGVRRL